MRKSDKWILRSIRFDIEKAIDSFFLGVEAYKDGDLVEAEQWFNLSIYFSECTLRWLDNLEAKHGPIWMNLDDDEG